MRLQYTTGQKLYSNGNPLPGLTWKKQYPPGQLASCRGQTLPRDRHSSTHQNYAVRALHLTLLAVFANHHRLVGKKVAA